MFDPLAVLSPLSMASAPSRLCSAFFIHAELKAPCRTLAVESPHAGCPCEARSATRWRHCANTPPDSSFSTIRTQALPAEETGARTWGASTGSVSAFARAR
jgi:hypothetical protein